MHAGHKLKRSWRAGELEGLTKKKKKKNADNNVCTNNPCSLFPFSNGRRSGDRRLSSPDMLVLNEPDGFRTLFTGHPPRFDIQSTRETRIDPRINFTPAVRLPERGRSFHEYFFTPRSDSVKFPTRENSYASKSLCIVCLNEKIRMFADRL